MKNTKPYPIVESRVSKSPFSDSRDVKDTLKKWKQNESIGFTRTSSLKAMGLIPRATGEYVLSAKYKAEK
jgi:hypothetical protein